MLYFIFSFALFIFIVTILITTHELGHFIMARRYGVKVERFSIGFGPALWKYYDKSGTEYVISMFPFGGYVKMFDEKFNKTSINGIHTLFNNKPILQRMIIIVSGPICNLIFAIFLYWCIYLIGFPVYRPIIGNILPNSIAEKFHFSSKMEFKSINGIKTPDWSTVSYQLKKIINKNKKISIEMYSLESKKTEWKSLYLDKHYLNISNHIKINNIIKYLGIIPIVPPTEPVIAYIQIGSAAMKSGLKIGDKIIKVNDQQITDWGKFATLINKNPGKKLNISVNRNGNNVYISIYPELKISKYGVMEGFAGISSTRIPLNEYKNIIKYNIFSSVVQAWKKTLDIIIFIIGTLGKFISGNIELSNLSGPISIAQIASISVNHGFIYYLMFIALISINLGIINLFPLPILDGGHLLFLIIEKIKGSPISEKVTSFSYIVSSILLILLMSISIFNDFSRL